MNITIIGRKCTPRDSFKERVERKLSKVEKFFADEASAKVTATVEKTIQIVEITVTSGEMIFRSESRADTLDQALDACIDNLIRRIRKNKTKIERKYKSGSFEDLPMVENVDDESEYKLVRTKSVYVKPQSVEEAILQMNLLGHEFYLFENAFTEEMNVVYKRKGGGYGLIEPGNADDDV